MRTYTLTRTSALLKTLFIIEHLPELVSLTRNVLGLVFINVPEVFRLSARLTADIQTLQARYPIHFRCQRSTLALASRALRPLKPAGRSCWPDCFQLAATIDGIELETANENLVELTGIEPVTSCLQSTRSPN